jgi:hypothetical protein
MSLSTLAGTGFLTFMPAILWLIAFRLSRHKTRMGDPIGRFPARRWYKIAMTAGNCLMWMGLLFFLAGFCFLLVQDTSAAHRDAARIGYGVVLLSSLQCAFGLRGSDGWDVLVGKEGLFNGEMLFPWSWYDSIVEDGELGTHIIRLHPTIGWPLVWLARLGRISGRTHHISPDAIEAIRHLISSRPASPGASRTARRS